MLNAPASVSLLYGSDDLRAKIELPSCQQCRPGDFLVFRPLNWEWTIHGDDDDAHWADPGAPSGGRSCYGDGNQNEDGEGEEDTQGGENGTRKGKGSKDKKGKGTATEDWKGKGKGKGKAMEKGKGKGKGIRKGKGIVEQIPGGDDISRAGALQLQKAMYEADSDMAG